MTRCVFSGSAFQKEKIDNESKSFEVERRSALDAIREHIPGDGAR
jgi:hypothetical protein